MEIRILCNVIDTRALIGPCSHVSSRWYSWHESSPSYRVYSNWYLATCPFFSSYRVCTTIIWSIRTQFKFMFSNISATAPPPPPPSPYPHSRKVEVTIAIIPSYISFSASDDRNLALKRTTYQSSTHATASALAQSWHAVDGNSDPDYMEGSCTYTASADRQPWWAVELDATYMVTHVTITNRGDCCGKWNTHVVIHECMHALTYMQTSMHIYLHTYIHTYTYIHACMYPSIHTCMHIYLHAYVHT